MKTEKIDIRVTKEQYDEIEKKSHDNSMTKSAFLIFCALNAKIDIEIGVDPAFIYLDNLVTFLEKDLITPDEYDLLKKRLLANGSLWQQIKKIEADNGQ